MTISSTSIPWYQTRSGRLTVGAGMLGLFVFVFWLAMKSRQMLSEPSALMVDEQHLWFGDVWEDSHFSWELPITNQGREAVNIKDFVSSCTCTEIDPKSMVIPAGNTRTIHLILNLVPKDPKEARLPVRDFDVSISPNMSTASDKSSRIRWKIRGRVRPVIQCDQLFIDLGRRSELAKPGPPQTMRITALVPLARMTASCSCSGYDVQVIQKLPNEKDCFELVLTPRAGLPRGAIHDSIVLLPESSEGKSLPPKKVEIVGQILCDIEAFPSNILFGACQSGTVVRETVTLRSLSGNPFRVEQVRCEGDRLMAERVSDPAGSVSAFQVKQRVVSLGEKNGKLFFDIVRQDKQKEEVMVRVSYCGIKSSSN